MKMRDVRCVMCDVNAPQTLGSGPHITHHTSHIAHAYTLIEALATLALVAIVVPVTFQALSLATSTAGVTIRRAEAVALAEGKLAELVAVGGWENTTLEGDFTQTASGLALEELGESRDYRWSATIADWTNPAFQELTVSVTWEHRGREYSTSISTLVTPQETTE